MATLEKIRNKSVLLFIVIIVALLAFILGDFLTSGRTYFGSPTTVAKAGSIEVEYQEYQQKISQLSEQNNNQGRSVSSDELSQQAIQAIMLEKLFNEEYEDLGITVTDEEISEATTGVNQHQSFAQLVAYFSQALGLETPNAAAVINAINEPAKYNITEADAAQMRTLWKQQEELVEQEILQTKFIKLLSGLFTYNKVDAQVTYDDNATTRHIAYVTKDATAVSNDEIEFSDADVEALWKSRKSNYRLDSETREVCYIYVPIEPDQNDIVAGQQAVENAIVALNEQPGVEGIVSQPAFVVNTVNVPASAITDKKLKDFATESEIGTASVIKRVGNDYTIAKLINRSTGIDSINISMIQAAPEVNLDSIAGLINAGASFADFNDGITTASQEDVWTALDGVQIDKNIRDFLAEAPVGKAVVFNNEVQGQQISILYRVNKRNKPVTFYEIANVEYSIDPSFETISNLSQQLRTYVSNNSSVADFKANAAGAGYAVLSDQVTASKTKVGNAVDSRRMIKWVMEAKKGQVSPIFNDDKQTYFLAVAVEDIYDEYLPATSAAINNRLTSEARNSKKADKLLADYAGKANDLQGYSELMGVEVAEGDVNITTPMLLNIGFSESALQGAIAAAKEGELVGPLKGNRGVLVFQVQSTNTDNRPFNEEEYGQRFSQFYNPLGTRNPLAFLLGSRKIDNRSLNFTSSIGE